MHRKIAKLGRKTGLKDKEIKKLCRFGLSGLLAVAVASLTGCLEANKHDQLKPSADKSPTPASSNAGVSASESVSPSTGPTTNQSPTISTPEPFKPPESEQCGPYPGYPCGTKYYTVSISDFEMSL